MDIFFFFSGPVSVKPDKNDTPEIKLEKLKKELEHQRNDKKHYYEVNKNSFVKECSTYNVGMAKSVLEKTGKRQFGMIVYAYDKFDNYQTINAQVNQELKSICSEAGLVPVEYEKTDDSQLIIQKICDKAGRNFLSEGNTVHIATNSGIRSNVMFFSTFIQILKCRNIKTKLYYEMQNYKCKLTPDGNEEEIDLLQDISINNEYYDILRGVELFTETGNPSKLKEYFKKNANPKLDGLFMVMEEFHQSVQICRREDRFKKNDKKSGIVGIYRELIQKLNQLLNDNELSVIFRLLIPRIQRSFVDYTIDDTGVKDAELIHIVRWCYRNGVIAQAYFVLKAELLYFFIDQGIVSMKNGRLPSKDTVKRVLGDLYNEEYLDYYLDYEYSTDPDKIQEGIKVYYKGIQNIIYSFMKKISIDCLKDEVEIRKVLEDLGFDGDKSSCYKAILLCFLVRNIRNCIAHSDNDKMDVLEETHNDNYHFHSIEQLLDVYNEGYVSNKHGRNGFYTINNNKKSILPSSPDFYRICEYILNKVLKDLIELCNRR